LASTNFSFKFNDNFNVQSHISYDKQNNNFEKKVYATTQGTLSHANGRYVNIAEANTQLYADLLATYSKKINDDLEITTNFGTSITHSRIGDKTTLDSGVSPGLGKANWFTIANFNGVNGISQSITSKRELQSVYGSMHLGYQEMLYADITARQDWSSTLPTAYFYPSFGATGIISKMINLPESINFAKVRASYSIVGNDIAPFLLHPMNSITAGNVSGPQAGPRPGETLKPEQQKEFEIGTDWKFFENRLGFEFTYYNSHTENQLIFISAPDTNPFGYKFYAINAASIANKGIELSLYAQPVRSDDYNWHSTLNFASNNNEVSGIPDDLNGRVLLTKLTANTYKYVLENGKPFGVIESMKLVRDANGNILLDGDDNLQKGDFEDVGNANPDFTLGWANSFDYKNFFLNIHIDGRFGGEVMSVTEAMLDGWGVSKRTGDARNAGGVNIDGLSNFDAETYYTTIGDRAGALGEYIYDATNVSLRELSLGYNYNFKEGLFIKNGSFSIIGRNLAFLYKKAPYDPNISLSTGEGLQGIDVFGLPSTKSIGFNLNLTF
jgi:outer membrane receptor protein involved in Fe transport